MDFRSFIYLKSKRCSLVAAIKFLAKLGLQYGCCNLAWNAFCQTYVFPANRNKIKSRRAGSNRLPLLQLRVCGQALRGCVGGCKCRIFRGVSFPCLAACGLHRIAFPVVSGVRRLPVASSFALDAQVTSGDRLLHHFRSLRQWSVDEWQKVHDRTPESVRV
jgi:hypothetical protein